MKLPLLYQKKTSRCTKATWFSFHSAMKLPVCGLFLSTSLCFEQKMSPASDLLNALYAFSLGLLALILRLLFVIRPWALEGPHKYKFIIRSMDRSPEEPHVKPRHNKRILHVWACSIDLALKQIIWSQACEATRHVCANVGWGRRTKFKIGAKSK